MTENEYTWAQTRDAQQRAQHNAAEATRRRFAEQDEGDAGEWHLWCTYEQFVAWLEAQGL